MIIIYYLPLAFPPASLAHVHASPHLTLRNHVPPALRHFLYTHFAESPVPRATAISCQGPNGPQKGLTTHPCLYGWNNNHFIRYTLGT